MKKERLLVLLSSVCLVLVLMVLPFMTACAKPAPAPVPPPAPAPTPAPKPAPTPAPTPADFYKGKTLTIVVPYSPGGGFDLCARVLAPFLQDKIGGKVVVKSMPAGATLVAHRHIYKVAKPDGLTLLFTSITALWMDEIMGTPGADWKSRELEILPVLRTHDCGIFVKPDGPYTTVEALRQGKGLKVGAVAPLNAYTIVDAVAIEILDLDAKLLLGYGGGTPLRLALAQAELDVIPMALDSAYQPTQQGELKVLFVVGEERAKAWPEVPALSELKKLSESEAELLKMWTTLRGGKGFMAPPGTPKDRVDFLVNVLDAIAADEAWQKADEKLGGMKPDSKSREWSIEQRELAFQNKQWFIELPLLIDKYKM